eukprot:6370286-Heterocapsa_arctica.AAC.1
MHPGSDRAEQPPRPAAPDPASLGDEIRVGKWVDQGVRWMDCLLETGGLPWTPSAVAERSW